jgi:hypothetical protein
MKTLFALWVSLLLIGSPAFGQDVPLAFEKASDQGNEEAEDGYDPFDPSINAPKLVRVQVEFVEMAHKDLTRLMMDEKSEKADATELRMKVQEMVDQDSARVIETQIVVGRSGQKQTTESIHEFIYPTEYEPMNCLPPQEGEESVKLPERSFPYNPATPTAFETRNVGSTLEAEPTIGENDRIVDIRFLPELIWHTGNTVWNERKDEQGNVYKVAMPDFYKLSINTSITCITGQYTMAGVVSPKDAKGEVDTDRKVMIFVKCSVLSVIP